MTVSELRAELERMERDGHGELLVGMVDCECHDSDYTMLDLEIRSVEIATATGNLGSEISAKQRFVRLS